MNEPISPDKNGREVMKMVLAGVLRPLKESCCVSSTLKMASRKAEQTAINNPTKGKYGLEDEAAIILYMASAGSNPKLTMSAKESSSLPIGEVSFIHRAVKPSKKSNTPAAHTK